MKTFKLLEIETDGSWKFTNLTMILLVAIGLICGLFSSFLAVIWGVVLFLTFYFFFTGQVYKIWYFVALSPGIEMLNRISKNPIIPYESGKYYFYLLIVLFFLARFDKRNKYACSIYNVGNVLLLLLLPSTLFSLMFVNFNFKNWVFNYSGIFQLAVLYIYLSKERWTKVEFFNILKLSSLPIIMMIAYLTIKTPKYEDMEFYLGANAKNSGGFASNQIATILGAQLLILALFMLINDGVFKKFYANIAIIVYALFRCLLTFSRGGVMSAVVALIIAIVIYSLNDRKRIGKMVALFVFAVIVSAGIFSFVNKLSGNLLFLRFTGETVGTMSGTKKKDLNTITDNRFNIVETDIGMFADYFFLGVGIGESRYHRTEYGGYEIIPHTEQTRLLSEHGVGGFFILVLFTLFPIFWIIKIPDPKIKMISVALYIFGYSMSLSAAMRTNITVVFLLLSTMPIIYSSKITVHKTARV